MSCRGWPAGGCPRSSLEVGTRSHAGCVDPDAPNLLDVRNANDGGLVRSGRRGGEDDLLNRGGAPLSGQELQD